MLTLPFFPSIDKVSLRNQLRKRRKQLTHRQRADAAHQVAFYAKRFLKRGKRIAGYWAVGSELDLTPTLLYALSRGASVFLPVIPKQGRRLWFSCVGEEDYWYIHPRYPIVEYAGKIVRAEKLDVIFVPLLGVDNDGNRLGQGGGFYDTTLAFKARHDGSYRPIIIGVAFDCQRVEQLPCESWDMRLNILITESGITHFHSLARNLTLPQSEEQQ